jgi:acyl-CoA reductase-like NAD-dependent aldehyde dehydrogenase
MPTFTVLVPWDFPMPILGWGPAPALAARNPVIAKPAERAPLTAMRIAELAAAAGLPDGAFRGPRGSLPRASRED